MQGRVISEGLNVREAPSAHGRVFDQLKRGDVVTVMATESPHGHAWHRIRLQRTVGQHSWLLIGWVDADFIEQLRPTPSMPGHDHAVAAFWFFTVLLIGVLLAWHAYGAECADLAPTYAGSGSSRSSTPAPCGVKDPALPDRELTPGACKHMSVEQLCSTKWGKDKRHVTASMKKEVFHAYGLTGNRDKSCRCKRHFEIDHLCSRELGGLDVISNLWPQCYCGDHNAAMKDRVENRLHKEVCAGNLALEKAQEEITTDWRVPYKRYFGDD